jgi:hypothetical protein
MIKDRDYEQVTYKSDGTIDLFSTFASLKLKSGRFEDTPRDAPCSA